MKTIKTTRRRDCRAHRGNQNPLEIRPVPKGEQARFDRLLSEQHYIGRAQPAGDFLRQVAILEGEWVGLLAWGAACYAIKDRDHWIGWSPMMKAERQKLIVQNRRFLLLAEMRPIRI